MTDNLLTRVNALKLKGVAAHWDECNGYQMEIAHIVRWEEEERSKRSLARRLMAAHLGRFKPLAEFDWQWPTKCDRGSIESLMQLSFIPAH